MRKRQRPQPIAPITTALARTVANLGRVLKANIHCDKGSSIGLFLQQRVESTLPCDPVLRLPGGHSPFFTDEDALAFILQELV